jgi:hypothetical protein
MDTKYMYTYYIYTKYIIVTKWFVKKNIGRLAVARICVCNIVLRGEWPGFGILAVPSRPNLKDYTLWAKGSGRSSFAVAFFRRSLKPGLLSLVATLLMAFAKNPETPKGATCR